MSSAETCDQLINTSQHSAVLLNELPQKYAVL